MRYILDTNIISQARRPERAPQISEWLRTQNEADLFLSVISLGEIERGIVLVEKTDRKFASDLKIWLERTVRLFSDRLIEFTAEDAVYWGELSARVGHNGADLMIAAQALARDAVVVTRNVSDFATTGVQVLDPTA